MAIFIKKSLATKGYSLVEVLIALGLLSAISMAVSALILQMNSQIIQAGYRTDRQSLQTQLEAVLHSPISCLNNLMSITLGSTPSLSLTSIKQYNDAGVAVSTVIPGLGVPINSGTRLVISSISYTGGGGLGTPDLLSTTSTLKTYSGALVFTFAAPSNGVVGLKPIIIPNISVRTNLAGVFQSCEMTYDPAMLCSQLGMVWNAATSICNPTLATACSALGGTVVGSSCIPPSTINNQCDTGQVLSGFDSLGGPICIVSGATPPSIPPATPLPSLPVALPSAPPAATPPPSCTPGCDFSTQVGSTDINQTQVIANAPFSASCPPSPGQTISGCNRITQLPNGFSGPRNGNVWECDYRVVTVTYASTCY